MAAPRIAYDLTGPDRGEPMVLVHGSWVDRRHWGAVVPELSRTFRVLSYDRRGHGESQAVPGTAADDLEDLAGLLTSLELAPAHVVGSSFGGCLALKFLAQRPELFRSVSAHEPPFIGLLEGDPAAERLLAETWARVGKVAEVFATGDHAAAAREFVNNVALGPGAWEALPEEVRAGFVQNAPTFFEELQDLDGFRVDLARLKETRVRVLLSEGTSSAPIYRPILDKLAPALPFVRRQAIPGAGHDAHLTHPQEFVAMLESFLGG